MVVLGVDPGTAITGYGFIEENSLGELKALSYGVITTPKEMPLEGRLQIIYSELKQLIHSPPTCFGGGGETFFPAER